MTRGRERRNRRRLLAMVALLGLLAFASWTWLGYRDPAALGQDYLYQQGTRSDSVDMQRYPQRHEVLIEPMGRNMMLPALLGYLPAPLGAAGRREAQGYFDTRDESIHILGEMARIQAGLPEPYPRGLFLRALRHEYGHAFFYDWAKDHGGTELFTKTIEMGQHASPDRLPDRTRKLMAEYAQAPADIYGDTYFTSRLSEYLAESYARFLDGREVPPEVRSFLEREGRARELRGDAPAQSNRRTSR